MSRNVLNFYYWKPILPFLDTILLSLAGLAYMNLDAFALMILSSISMFHIATARGVRAGERRGGLRYELVPNSGTLLLCWKKR